MTTFKAGDMVMVVKPRLCCGGVDDIGRVCEVANYTTPQGFRYFCRNCSTYHPPLGYLNVQIGKTDFGGVHQQRVIKLPPMSDPEEVSTNLQNPILETA